MPSPWLVTNRPKKMAAVCGGLYFMFLGPPPLSEVSGFAAAEDTPVADLEGGGKGTMTAHWPVKIVIK